MSKRTANNAQAHHYIDPYLFESGFFKDMAEYKAFWAAVREAAQLLAEGISPQPSPRLRLATKGRRAGQRLSRRRKAL